MAEKIRRVEALTVEDAATVVTHRKELKKGVMVNVAGTVRHMSTVLMKPDRVVLIKLDTGLNLIIKREKQLVWGKQDLLNKHFIFTALIPTSVYQGCKEHYELYTVSADSEMIPVDDVILYTVPLSDWWPQHSNHKLQVDDSVPCDVVDALDVISYEGCISDVLDMNLGVFVLDQTVTLYVGQLLSVDLYSQWQIGSKIQIHSAHYAKHSEVPLKMSLYCCILSSVVRTSSDHNTCNKQSGLPVTSPVKKWLYNHQVSQCQLEYVHSIRQLLYRQLHKTYISRTETVVHRLLQCTDISLELDACRPRKVLEEFLAKPHDCALSYKGQQICLPLCSVVDILKIETQWTTASDSSIYNIVDSQKAVVGFLDTCKTSGQLVLKDDTANIEVVLSCCHSNHSCRQQQHQEQQHQQQHQQQEQHQQQYQHQERLQKHQQQHHQQDQQHHLQEHRQHQQQQQHQQHYQHQERQQQQQLQKHQQQHQHQQKQQRQQEQQQHHQQQQQQQTITCSSQCKCDSLMFGDKFPCPFVHVCCIGKLILVDRYRIVTERLMGGCTNSVINRKKQGRITDSGHVREKRYLLMDMRDVKFVGSSSQQSRLSDNEVNSWQVKNQQQQQRQQQQQESRQKKSVVADGKVESDYKFSDIKHEMTETGDNLGAYQILSNEKLDSYQILSNAKLDSNQTLSNAKLDSNQTLSNAKLDSNQTLSNAKLDSNQILSNGKLKNASSKVYNNTSEQNDPSICQRGSKTETVKDLSGVERLKEVVVFIENKGCVINEVVAQGKAIEMRFSVEGKLVQSLKNFQVCLLMSGDLLRYYPVLRPGVAYKLSLPTESSPLLCVQLTNRRVLQAAMKSKSRVILRLNGAATIEEDWDTDNQPHHRLTPLPQLLQSSDRSTMVSFIGLIVRRLGTDPDYTAGSGNQGNIESCVRLLVEDPQQSYYKIWVYVNESEVGCPRGLLPGVTVVLYNVQRKVSQQGKVYCRLTPFSTVQHLCTLIDSPNKPSSSLQTLDLDNIPVHHLGNIHDVAVFQCICDVVRVYKLWLKCVCKECGSQVIEEKCYNKSCGREEYYRFMAKLILRVDDGTCVAMVTVLGDHVRDILQLKPQHWTCLEQEVAKFGEVYYNQFDPDHGSPVEQYVCMVCQSSCINRTWIMVLKPSTKRKANQDQLCGGIDENRSNSLRFPEFQCVDLQWFNPSQAIVKYALLPTMSAKTDNSRIYAK